MSSTNFQPGTVVQSVWLDEVDSASFQFLAAVTGTNTITAQGPQSYVAYTQQAGFILNPQNSSTGAVTLNINGLGAKAVTKYGTTPLVSGDILVGTLAYIIYDGVRFQLLNPQSQDLRIAFTGRLIGTQTITTTQSYTPTAGTTRIIIELVGGGGGGGGAPATGAGVLSIGVGGSGGGYCKSLFTSGFSGQTITIGAAGTAGAAGGAGGAGGNSTFLGMTASGGGLGAAGAAGAAFVVRGVNPGGAAAGGNIINIPGGPVSTSFGLNAAGVLVPSEGGDSFFGAGSKLSGTSGAPFSLSGTVGTGFGSGGSGGATWNGAAVTGGAGTPGIAIIHEYS